MRLLTRNLASEEDQVDQLFDSTEKRLVPDAPGGWRVVLDDSGLRIPTSLSDRSSDVRFETARPGDTV